MDWKKKKNIYSIFLPVLFETKIINELFILFGKEKIHTESKNKMIMELDKVSITGFNLTEKSIYVYKNHLVF